MLEERGNIWEYAKPGNVLCFTSNGVTKSNGELVMGAGIAKQFRDKFPFIAEVYGAKLRKSKQEWGEIEGNRPIWLPPSQTMNRPFAICSFPTKHHWRDQSDPKLIVNSAKIIEHVVFELNFNKRRINKVYLTRPGCGNGGLQWEDVKPLLTPILDDTFVVLVP